MQDAVAVVIDEAPVVVVPALPPPPQPLALLERGGFSEVSLERDYQVKLVLLGDSGVGKSSLLKRYTTQQFPGETLTTIGIDYDCKHVKLGGRTVRVAVYDTAGLERFRSITSSYFRAASGVILMADVSDQLSLEHLDEWMRDVRTFNVDAPCMLFVNKTDIPRPLHAFTLEEATAKARRLGIAAVVETSAKGGTNVERAFDICTRLALAHVQQHERTKFAQNHKHPQHPQPDAKTALICPATVSCCSLL